MTIPRFVVADMLAHAREEAPRECCGLLVGRADAILRNVRARNLEAGTSGYLVDPADHFAAIHAARSEGAEVVGAYHSHPATPPVPSPRDIAEATSGPDFLYVIVSLAEEEVRAYRLREGAFTACPFDFRF